MADKPNGKPTKEAFPGSSLLINLVPLPLTSAPTFPAFSELLGDVARVEKYQKKDGLFQSLLGDPKVLWQDLLDHPDKYEPAASHLIQQLVAGNRTVGDLTHTEMQILDKATLDFSQPARVPPKEPSAPKPPPEVRGSEADIEYHEPVEAPISVDGMKPYWWLR